MPAYVPLKSLLFVLLSAWFLTASIYWKVWEKIDIFWLRKWDWSLHALGPRTTKKHSFVLPYMHFWTVYTAMIMFYSLCITTRHGTRYSNYTDNSVVGMMPTMRRTRVPIINKVYMPV